MQGAPFYDAGTPPTRGMRSAVVFARRLLRRVLRPMLFQLDAELRSLAAQQERLDERLRSLAAHHERSEERIRSLIARQERLESVSGRQDHLDARQHHLDGQLRTLSGRQDHLDERLRSAMALAWDHIAMARRLAAIEDHLDELSSGSAAGSPPPLNEGGAPPLIRYPGHDDHRPDETRHMHAPQSKVS